MVPKDDVGIELQNAGNEVIGNARQSKRRGTKICLERRTRFTRLCWKKTWQVGREDPRRVIHSLKVGLSLTLVSLLYLMEPLFKGIGSNAIWAVMTVVVVFEFTAGATLCKGLNRGIGTLLAGSLAFIIEFVANESGRVFRAVFIGIAVFLVGTAATYMRFFPYLKKNYDYGILIFLLTFNLITVSSYRKQDVLEMAKERLYTIAIGCAICLFMTLLVFPNWSGEDLHSNTVYKLEGLAKCIEVCVNEYFSYVSKLEGAQENLPEDPIYEGYKTVLDSKSLDETLALHASWEPRHSRYCYKFPWQQYVKVGAVLRRFGYTVVALHGCLQTEIQTPLSVRNLFKDPCIRLAGELSKALMELAKSIENRRHCSPEILSDNLQKALQDLNGAIKFQPRLFLGSNNHQPSNMLALAIAQARQKHEKDSKVSSPTTKTSTSPLKEGKDRGGLVESPREAERRILRPQLSKITITSLEFSEALPFAAFASLLVEAVARLDNVIEEVEKLGKVAGFREYESDANIVVTCGTPRVDVSTNYSPSRGLE